MVRSTFRLRGVSSVLRKELVEYGEDLARVRDALHREVPMPGGDLAVGAPEIAVAHEAARPVAHLDIGEVLADGQELGAEELDAAARIGAIIVAVRGLCRVDVPGVERIALARDLQHLLERRGDHGAAGLAAVEERLLV